MHATLGQIAGSDTRPPKARRTAHHVAQRHDSADAPLSCALDLPRLHRDIPAQITLNDGSDNRLRDSLLHLAFLGTGQAHFKIASNESVIYNLLRAGEAAIATALKPLTPYGLISSTWISRVDAETADMSCEACHSDAEPLPTLNDYDGENVVIVEINTGKKYETSRAGRVEVTRLGQRTQTIESVCPGFIDLVYTVLELVNRHLYPVITPRTLFENYLHDGRYEEATSFTDSAIATSALLDCYEDFDEMLKTHGFTANTVTHEDIIQIYQEQVGGYLPSDFISQFGTASLCHYYCGEHEELPVPREPSLWSDLNIARAKLDLRPAHETATQHAIQALQLMIELVREINSGARFVSGANHLHVPSLNAVKVCPSDHEIAFDRILDDATRGAMENGDTVNALGWIVARADSHESTAKSLHKMHRGAVATAQALDFLHFLGAVA